ncbi:lysosomal phospholipase A and acyltransferase-like [Babylonia areolata]|uniref:lysosomal phospholipase A and acyltransferase-like n=1 Tax=Babylonia areolata TaxID=304850 RepID=UPI003FD38A37
MAFSSTSVLFVLLFCLTSAKQPKYPVILVPGDGGSQLFAKLDRPTVPHFYCSQKTAEYYNIWLDLEELAPVPIDCFVDNMKLRYNRTTHTSHNAEGVDIRIDSFGETQTVEWLDPDRLSHDVPSLAYFYTLVEMLVAHNYTRNVNIKGAPYDFRRAPNELGDFYKNLTRLIEDTYVENGNSPMVMVAHSMGNPVMLYFYNHMPLAWKNKYIRAHIALAGVWAGAVKPIRLMTSGDSLGVIVVSPLTVRPEQRAMPSTAWLMPSTRLWNSSEVLVITEHRNYTVSDYQQLFKDINYTDGFMLWQDTKDLIIDLQAPQVEVHGVHGYGLPTPGVLKFKSGGFPDTYPDTIPDDGDGTVNIRSLEAFLGWEAKQKAPVKHLVLKGAEHMAILKDPRTLDYVLNFLFGGGR